MPFKSFLKFFPAKQALSWAFYDFANSAYSLLIFTFIFPIFFREVIASSNGDFWWGLAVSSSILLGGIASPVIGAIADYHARRKRKFIFFALCSILGTTLLYFTGPGLLFFSFLLFVVTNLCFEIAQTLYDSFLLHVSTQKTAGTISGLGWGLGYLGGIAAMLLLKPFYAGGYAGGSLYKLTFPLTALFFLLFALPTFFLMKEPEREAKKEPFLFLLKKGFSTTLQTLKNVKQHKNIAWFLLGFYLFNDALVTIFAFVPIFAKVTLQMDFSEIALLLFIVQLIGFPASVFFGWLSDKKGAKNILLVTLILWCFIIVGISLAETKIFFYVMAILAGCVIGSSQAVARSWYSKIIPWEKRGEFFGFNGFASKIAATTGPLFFGIISSVTGSQRLAMGMLVIYLVVAIGIFVRMKEERTF